MCRLTGPDDERVLDTVSFGKALKRYNLCGDQLAHRKADGVDCDEVCTGNGTAFDDSEHSRSSVGCDEFVGELGGFQDPAL